MNPPASNEGYVCRMTGVVAANNISAEAPWEPSALMGI